jgi:hypothetical protein
MRHEIQSSTEKCDGNITPCRFNDKQLCEASSSERFSFDSRCTRTRRSPTRFVKERG